MTKPGETITVLDDEGLPHNFTLVEVVEVEDRRYAVLQPDDVDAGAVLFRVEGEAMTVVDNGEEFDRVVDALKDLDEYDDLVIEDEDEDDDDDEDEDVDDEYEEEEEGSADEDEPGDDLDDEDEEDDDE